MPSITAPAPATPSVIRTASLTAQIATTTATCSPRMPWRSTNAFWAPIATISERPKPRPERAASRSTPTPSLAQHRNSSYRFFRTISIAEDAAGSRAAPDAAGGGRARHARRRGEGAARHAVGGQPAAEGARDHGRPRPARAQQARAGDARRRGGPAARSAGRAARRRHERRAGADRGAAAARGRGQRRLAGHVVPAGDRAAGRRGGDRAAPRGRGQHRAAAAGGHGGRRDHLRRRAGGGLHGHRARDHALPADGLQGVRAPLAPGRPDRGGAGRGADDDLRPRRRAADRLPAAALARRRPRRRRWCRPRRTSCRRSRSGWAGGWCPTSSARRPELVELEPGAEVDVALHLQRWRIDTPSLDRLAGAIVAGARERLIR